jgi:hypothetical protein
MNEEQRAVLAAIHRMEGNPGTLIDEYTVARSAGVLARDLTGNEYLHAPGREQIRHTLDELETLGLVRLDREGYWRPRTTLSGRRALERPLVALPTNRPRLVPTPGAESAATPGVGAAEGPTADTAATNAAEREADRGRWPVWWPVVFRVGDPSLTPIVGPIVAILALVLVVAVGARVLGGGAAATPTPDLGLAQTATIAAQGPPSSSAAPVPTRGTNPGGNGAATQRPVTPTRVNLPTPTNQADRPPTPTAGPPATRLMVANTENKGAFLYATPAGERRIAVPEGFILEVIGPDERDTKGQNWKHIRYLNFEGWIPEEYTMPAE